MKSCGSVHQGGFFQLARDLREVVGQQPGSDGNRVNQVADDESNVGVEQVEVTVDEKNGPIMAIMGKKATRRMKPRMS